MKKRERDKEGATQIRAIGNESEKEQKRESNGST